MTATATERAMRPLLLRPHLVRATLDGRKTQTRRVAKGLPDGTTSIVANPERDGRWWPTDDNDYLGDGIRCPYGQPGDLLWVRETWAQPYQRSERSPGVIYLADGPDFQRPTQPGYHGWGRRMKGAWKPSIHMPRWACRLVLEVTEIRIERLQATSEEGAIAEGVTCDGAGEYGHGLTRTVVHAGGCCVRSFAALWHDINAKRGYGWDANPWVWVVSYRVYRTGAGAAE